MDLAAVALGAQMVEKTLTLDRQQSGPEHGFSLEPADAPRFVRAIRDLEVALGEPRRRLGSIERAGKVMARRSAFLRTARPAGHVLTVGDLDWRRPGDGITPPEGPYLVGRRLARDVEAGVKLAWVDLA